MSIISDDELGIIRDAIATLLPDTCVILSPTNVSDGQGGMTQTWGTVAAAQPCRVDPIRGNVALSGAEISPFTNMVLTVAHDANLQSNYRVVYGGQTFNVEYLFANKSWSGSTRAYISKV